MPRNDRTRTPDDYDRRNDRNLAGYQYMRITLETSHHSDRYYAVLFCRPFARVPDDSYPAVPDWTISGKRARHVGALALRIQTDDEHRNTWYGAALHVRGDVQNARTLRAVADTMDAFDRAQQNAPDYYAPDDPIATVILWAESLGINQYAIDDGMPTTAGSLRVLWREHLRAATRHWPINYPHTTEQEPA